MTQITKNKRTHILILRDGRKFNVTQDQYAGIRLAKEDKKRTDMFQLRDADTKELVFDGEYGDIKEFQERKQDNALNEKRWVCEFNELHTIPGFPDNCNCKHKYKTLGIIFIDKIKELGYNINSYREITPEMKVKYLENINKLI